MSEAKHTPGPWKAEVDNDSRDDGADEITAGGIVIARVEGADEIKRRILAGRVEGPGCTAAADALDEVDANARLIASAPDLLAALEAMNHMGGDDRGGYCICPRKDGSAPDEEHATPCRDARAALAKARGQ